MALFNRNKPTVESLGALIGQEAKQERSKQIKEQATKSTKAEYNSDRLVTIFGKEGSLGKSMTEKNKSFFAAAKEKMMIWGKQRTAEAQAKFHDYGVNYLTRLEPSKKAEQPKEAAPAQQAERANETAPVAQAEKATEPTQSMEVMRMERPQAEEAEETMTQEQQAETTATNKVVEITSRTERRVNEMREAMLNLAKALEGYNNIAAKHGLPELNLHEAERSGPKMIEQAAA